ncbi:MAG: polyprenyl synthetase family protein [Proteobacteria bacterium]|nr:polyprenyl synthetase family protein [Pseudomonadota bacterium]
MFELKSYLESRRDLFEKKLDALLNIPSSGSGRLLSAMRYSLLSGGKRLRPILCFAAAEAVGGSPSQCMTTACALEMIHTYSLIHDDLPAMDDDNLRRGMPTCHKAFDEASAILAGDGLLTLALYFLSSPSHWDSSDPALNLTLISLISHAAGQQGMIEGQMLDMESQGKNLSLDELEQLHRLKTGAMITVSIRCGAMLAGANSHQIQSLENYAAHIGLAFQVADDILNVTGNSALMGKATGTDDKLNKATYPSLLGLEPARAFARELVDKSLRELEPFDAKADPLRSIALYIIERNR